MAAARTVAFNLNGAHVTAVVEPHHTLSEVLQTQLGLTGARESCCRYVAYPQVLEPVKLTARKRRSVGGNSLV